MNWVLKLFAGSFKVLLATAVQARQEEANRKIDHTENLDDVTKEVLKVALDEFIQDLLEEVNSRI